MIRRRRADAGDGPPLWVDGAAVPRPPLDGDTTADVVVVGGGLTGLWTAYYLLDADPALDVLVVEAGVTGQDERGVGACSARVGLTADALAARHSRTAAAHARALLRDAVVEVGGVAAVEEIDCGFAFGGELVLAADDDALTRIERQAAAAQRWGDETHVLDVAGLRERVLVDDAVGGTWSPEAARLDPGRLARGLADVLVARAARIADRTPAARVVDQAVVTPHGTVRAATVVDTRPEAPELRAWAATLATAPLPDATWARIGLEDAEVLAHGDGLRVVRTPDGRLVAGRARPGAPRLVRALDALLRPPASASALHDLLVDLLPVLTDAPVTHAWLRPLAAPGALPSVGHVPGATWARSGGTGPAAANVAGRTVAELVTGTASELATAPWVRRA
ncbi:FAD-dependent oxidoreductase [Cellulomonas sp.]|uniref:NAD(P)/FAD-dependent oxidoreductase n=1 Tax=Cellulomonas sp. TaxID=40001 RepID=UPI002589AE77|nr:FAD-dependent oxidoreductase [Cellulomonas sp.]MCR6689649.1 FAD-binding oxidoreductase [Cellulomonas sp.]